MEFPKCCLFLYTDRLTWLPDLLEAEEIERWQEYTELCKKRLNDPANHDGVITHLEPDTLESKAKWTLGSIMMIKTIGSNKLCLLSFENAKKQTGLSPTDQRAEG